MSNPKADSALWAIPAPADRPTWLDITMAYKAAGGDFDTWDKWSSTAPGGYNAAGNRNTWQSIDPNGGKTEATLYHFATAQGWTPPKDGEYTPRRAKTATKGLKTQNTAAEEQPTPAQIAKIRAYIVKTRGQQAQIMDYCNRRGLTADTVERFNLGYDSRTKRLVIPYPGADYYNARLLTPAQTADPNNPTAPKYAKPHGIAAQIFNAPALTGGAEVVFITEGELDAISLEQYGGAAIGSNAHGVVLNAIATAGDKLTAKRFLIVPDNDKDEQGNPDPTKGEDTARRICEALTGAGYEAYIYPLPEQYHDSNDMGVKAGADFWEWIRQGAIFAEEQAILVKEQARAAADEYRGNTSALAKLADLEATIERNKSIEAIKTGFPTLDNLLGDKGYPGGLYPGLYFIGAVSSLGKTTFALQMADNIAAAGYDVLIFSLEMPAVELMAKSISRLTYHTANAGSERKTTRGILSGIRYDRYSTAELDTISRAKEQYKELAERVYITEAMGDIGAADIRASVERHLKITRQKPVVFIDYLQILAPEDTKATDKQNTDRAVVELKRMSRDYDIPVIAISSFNRENYKNEVGESAFKESGAIEYSSDVLIGLQFQGAGKDGFNVRTAKAKNPRKIELFVLKNRNGATNKDPLPFNFYQLFNYYEDVNGGAVVPLSQAPQGANLAELAKKRR